MNRQTEAELNPEKKPKSLSLHDAKAQGYRPVTNPYLPDEDWMMTYALRDLKGVDTCLVCESDGSALGQSIWRK